ncbi:hypothetical protein BH10BAC3_BH10BAC3_38940 [soil metagenome]
MKKLLAYLFVFFLGVGCKSNSDAAKQLTDYDLTKPEKFIMPESLLEISGITFYNGKNDTIYAIQDEEGKVFRVALGLKKQWHTKFGKQGDYEDLTILHDKVVILQSNGTFYVLPFEDAIYVEADTVQEFKKVLPTGEYESLYGDAATGNMFIICKNCPSDDNKDKVSGYILDVENLSAAPKNFSIDVESIKHFTGKVKRGFRPSGLAKNPITNEWYIISAVNQLLVVADSNWTVKDAYPLNGAIFNQPEGIVFDMEGNLYISNEGDDLSTGNILKFKKVKK